MPALKANTPQGERKKERKWNKRRNCASNTLCCMCFLFGPLASVTVIVIRCLTLLKKKKKRRVKKKDPAMFFPSLLEMSSELPGRGMQAIPWSWGMTWELRYMGAIRGEGPWLPVSPGLFGLDGSVILPHRWRLACLSLSPPAPQASCAYQLCAKHTAVHGKTVPANLKQWFITNNRRRYREVCVNAVQHEWSRLQLMKSKKKNCQRVRKGIIYII